MKIALCLFATIIPLFAQSVTYSVEGNQVTSNYVKVEKGYYFDKLVTRYRTLENIVLDSVRIIGFNGNREIFFFGRGYHGSVFRSDIPASICEMIDADRKSFEAKWKATRYQGPLL